MNDPVAITRSGTVAIVGRSNVGKSTLLNAALDLPLAVVSRRPQTTRDQLLGVVRHSHAEIGLLDTPGFHRAQNRLGQEMNRVARNAYKSCDVAVFVVAVPKAASKTLTPHPSDLALFRELPEETPKLLVINKIDHLRDKRLLLPLMQSFADELASTAVVPISALKADGITHVLNELAPLLPEGSPTYDEDTITTRPLRYFAAEYVREPILRATGDEVPHAVAITVDNFSEPVHANAAVRIDVTIHVERAGQKGILIGKQGEMLKRIGTSARKRIEQLLGRQINLKLWVRVTKDWRQRPQMLSDFGLSGIKEIMQ